MVVPKFTRARIYQAEGKPIEITWPPDGPEPKKGSKYSIQSSADKPGESKLIVDSIRELPDGFKCLVRLDADPIRLLGKQMGYATSGQGAIGTRKPVDNGTVGGGIEFRAEVEPEAVDAETQRKISTGSRHNRAQVMHELALEDEEVAEELARVRERAVRDRLRMVCRGLDGAGAMALLGSIERKLREAETKQMKEAVIDG